jgi:hypothetical protein
MSTEQCGNVAGSLSNHRGERKSMFSGGWSIQNILSAHSLAILLIVIGALALIGILTVSFRGAVVI